MAPYALNAVTIDVLTEQPRAEFDLDWLFPKNTFEQFMEQRDWMVPRFFDPEKRKVILSIHTFVIRTKHHRHPVRYLLRQSQGARRPLSVPHARHAVSAKSCGAGLQAR